MKKSKGFTLIEIIVYMGLLSVLMIAMYSFSLSSVYSGVDYDKFSEEDYQLLIKNYHAK